MLLAVLGYHDAAGQVLFVTLLIGPLVAYGVTKLEEIDAILEPLRTTRGRREALLYLLAYLVYALGTSCLGRLFDRS